MNALGRGDRPSVSVIVPTFREVLNLPNLIRRIAAVRAESQLELELLVVDDQSDDGSAEAVAEQGLDWVRFIEHRGARSLSLAVLQGLREARNDVVVVMDADLSHPPERLPEMLDALQDGARVVMGSRFVEGGTTEDEPGFFRWLLGRVAILLARPLTDVADPMSGYLALWRKDVRVDELSPVGYKIGLELLVRCGARGVVELPIHFAERTLGASKLGLKQQLLYLQHLRRLYLFRFATLAELVHFGAVGASGVVVNIAVLTALVELGMATHVAVAAAIAVSMVSNFVLNRRLTFGYARGGNIWRQFVGFVAACSVGAILNYGFTLGLIGWWPTLPVQVAAMGGVMAGLGFNFLANRFLVFKKRHVLTKSGISRR